jgi:hypothetical protein
MDSSMPRSAAAWRKVIQGRLAKATAWDLNSLGGTLPDCGLGVVVARGGVGIVDFL